MNKFTLHGLSRKRGQVLFNNRFHFCLVYISNKCENEAARVAELLFVHFHNTFVIYLGKVFYFDAFCQRIVTIKSFCNRIV